MATVQLRFPTKTISRTPLHHLAPTLRTTLMASKQLSASPVRLSHKRAGRDPAWKRAETPTVGGKERLFRTASELRRCKRLSKGPTTVAATSQASERCTRALHTLWGAGPPPKWLGMQHLLAWTGNSRIRTPVVMYGEDRARLLPPRGIAIGLTLCCCAEGRYSGIMG